MQDRLTLDGKPQTFGKLRIELFAEDGHLKEIRETDNIITTVGRNAITDQLLATPAIAKSTHMALGTGTTAAAVGDTALVTEIAASRVALTSKTRSTNVLTQVGDWAAGTATNAAITEAGAFNASTGGDMYSRAVFAAINKASGDTLKITWTYTIG